MDTNIIHGDVEIQNFLQAKIDQGGIAAAVVQEALKATEISVVEWFRGLVEHGCVTGWDGSLIYYADTHDFFDQHYDEIEALREEWVDQTGQDLQISGDLKNYLAWFGFEQTAWNIMQEAGWEYPPPFVFSEMLMRQENWPLARRFTQAILHLEIFHYNQRMPQIRGRYFFIQNVMSFEQGARDSESELGIDYHEQFSGDLRQILMAGEREWLANAAELHRWDTGEMWSVVMLPRLTEGRLKPEDYKDLKRFCPRMLDAMSRQRIKRTKSQIMARTLAALEPEK